MDNSSSSFEFYFQRFVIILIVVFSLAISYAYLFGSLDRILNYSRYVSGALFLCGALAMSTDSSNQSHDLAGKASGANFGSSAGTAGNHDPFIKSSGMTNDKNGIEYFLVYGGLLVFIFTFILNAFM